MHKQVISFVLSLLFFALIGSTNAHTVIHARVGGLEGSATFARADGCVVTESALLAVASMTQTSGGTTTTKTEAILAATVFDACTGQPLDRLDTLASAVTFSGDVNVARLVGTLVVRDSNGNVRDLLLDLSFAGIGTTTRNRSRERLEEGSTKILIRHDGSTRDAIITGSIDGFDIAGTVGSAQITTEREATLTITHP